MKEKSIKRYQSFCRSLDNLEKSRNKNPKDDMVLESAVQRFNLSFDLSWKVMKDILTEQMGILDFATGSPRETLQTAFTNGMIHDDIWLRILRTRNRLAHDYDGYIAMEEFHRIVGEFYEVFVDFRKRVEKYYAAGADFMEHFE